LKRAGENQAQTKLTLEDGTPYDRDGKLQFAEVTVDPGTGSVTLRAIFPNPDGVLLPGMFVHERLDEGVDEKGLLVPQRAITHNQRGEATALVVGSDDQVATRIVKTDRAVGDQWLVSDGLAAGDRVVVVGLQRVQGGGKVKPHEVSPDQPDLEPTQSAQSNKP
jgi:membrane fusion protein (multidrug efflux system)